MPEACVPELKLIKNLLLPLVFLTTTVSANLWSIGGIYIGQVLFWIFIGLSFFVVLHTRYVGMGFACIAAYLTVTLLFALWGGEMLGMIRVICMAGFLVIVGAEVYGKNPALLRKQLLWLLALSIPIMLCQILGVSSFFMYWNTEYAHDLNVLSIEEIGTFKEISVFPTFLRGPDEVYYQIGQGRPVGLLYSNNIMSIFVAVATALTLSYRGNSRLGWAGALCSVAIVLTMSQMALGIVIALCVFLILFGSRMLRWTALKFGVLTSILYGLYAICFPGLIAVTLSPAKFWSSFLDRVLDVALIFEADVVFDYFANEIEYINWKPKDEASFSTLAILLKSDYLVPAIFIAFTLFYLLLIGVRKIKKLGLSDNLMPTLCVGIACAISQLAVPYMAAPSFQLLMGFVLFPLFRRMWDLRNVQFQGSERLSN
jgi:hypothetical protein